MSTYCIDMCNTHNPEQPLQECDSDGEIGSGDADNVDHDAETDPTESVCAKMLQNITLYV